MGTYADVPLPHSRFGEAQYRAGRCLVADGAIQPAELVWDADEVLWDWVLDLRRVLRFAPRFLWTRDLGHRELFRLKPGVLELIWGLRHAALERDLDPYLRIWTNGYPWRLWRICLELPGLARLLGPPCSQPHAPPDAFSDSPYIFYRRDYVKVIGRLIGSGEPGLLGDLPPKPRQVLRQALRTDPLNANLKVPELARLAGKSGFTKSTVLVDDQKRNVARFVATGRRGIVLKSPRSGLWRGQPPNTTWRDPEQDLARLGTAAAPPLAEALRRLARGDGPLLIAPARDKPGDHRPVSFSIHVLDRRLRAEWIVPLKQLRRLTKLTLRNRFL